MYDTKSMLGFIDPHVSEVVERLPVEYDVTANDPSAKLMSVMPYVGIAVGFCEITSTTAYSKLDDTATARCVRISMHQSLTHLPATLAAASTWGALVLSDTASVFNAS